jgi:hypothetical protein
MIRKMGIDKITKIAAYLLLPLLVGCVTTSPPTERTAEKTFQEFLEDGKTSKQMVILKLGQPSGTFEGERILTYRIGRDEKGYLVLDRQARLGWWDETKYFSLFSLVLIFDEKNVLSKHSMVAVR